MQSRNLHLGTFNAEYFWRPANAAALPSVLDPRNRNLIYAMDDLLAIGTNSSEDYVLTRYGFYEPHENYLKQLGYSFKTHQGQIGSPSKIDHTGFECISSILEQQSGTLVLPPTLDQITPYAITSGIYSLAKTLPGHPLPTQEAVESINNKSYSTFLMKTLTHGYQGEVVQSDQEILHVGYRLINKHGKIVLKEAFGVAGNGNMIIDSDKTLNRMFRHFARQKEKGKDIEVILEPFLDKHIDFSSHWEISPYGTYEFLGFQQMVNEGFAFSQIITLPEQWVNLVEQSNYYNITQEALQAIYQKGYYGPICFDSMILKDNSIAPIVEINARMSMGLLNHKLNKRFDNNKGTLFFMTLVVPNHEQQLYDSIQGLLKQLKLQFTPEAPKGFMILSANTLRANAQLDPEEPYRARLYLWHTEENTLNSDTSQLRDALQAKGIMVQ